MPTENIWHQAVDLMNRAFQVTSDLDLPRGDKWPTLVTVCLSQANERLDSIRVLLDKNYWDSAVILTRSIFELAVNLAYIARNTAGRLPQYLKHGGIPLTSEEAQQLQQAIERSAQPAVKDIVPGQAWKRLRDMCRDLSSDWLKEYETFYRYASVPTHAGAFTLGKNYKRLLDRQPPLDHEKAVVLVTASTLHLRVAEIAANVFPEQIELQKVEEFQDECRALGQFLARMKKAGGIHDFYE